MDSLEALLAYIPSDRRDAIAAGGELPHRTSGTALCADLSGFTPLTEALARNLGPRRGAEELALYLNRFYDVLIAPVGAYGGSVVTFSGDAITCWFDADNGQRAVAAAQAMQTAMQPFASLPLSNGESISLGVKIAIVSGPVRRFQVGDPNIQFLDTLAGASMDRLAVLGYLARTGEILLDEVTAARWSIAEWRSDPLTGQRAAVLNFPVTVSVPQSLAESPILTEEQIRPWLLPAVFARLQGGRGEFLTELRPAVALFMRFGGLNYDDEQVDVQLDAVIRAVQRILAEYDGTLLQLTIGDKGSYLYAAFGAPVAHEDDVTRAVNAALELRGLSQLASVSVGLSRGLLRTGAYGSATRRIYGVLGDAVNLSARLMESAAPGQILASESIWQDSPDFDWQALPALDVKGKHAPITPAALLGRLERDAFAVRTHLSALPMIGRQDELLRVEEKLALVRQGRGQIVRIVAEAGMGKSRLLAEVLQRAAAQGITCYSGECQSYGTQSAYLVWHAIWRMLFGISAVASTEQIETLEKTLARINPDFALRLPLLGPALNLSIPDNGLTSGMDARLRKTSRESLLVDFLRAQATNGPLILILEDVHWIDSVSVDLLEGLGRAIETLPVLILLAHRPMNAVSGDFLPGLMGLAYATDISLNELTVAEIGQLLAVRLAYFGLDGEIPLALVDRLAARTQGNPFYAEELLNYLYDRGLDPRDDTSWEQADLPNSLQSLILSRIDQLNERQQITIKAASVIGRLFRAIWLYEYYPSLGGEAQVAVDLERLSRIEMIAPETPMPHLAYLFKHVITQEVAYESLAYATRTNLHEQFAAYLEQVAGEDVGPFLDLLAYHYERTENLPKKRLYLRKAGEAAEAAFANEAALSYFGRALALAPENDYVERFAILTEREKVLNILGKREAQDKDLANLSLLADILDDNARRAQAAVNRSKYARTTNDYMAAIVAAQQAVELAHLAGADEHEARAYWLWGESLFFQGNYSEARARYEQALVVAQTAKLTNLMANILMGFGSLDTSISNYDSAQTYLERALQLQREVGDRIGENLVLSCMGDSAYLRGNFSEAEVYYEQTLHSWRSIGYKQSEGRTLCRLGSLVIQQADNYEKARRYCEQALPLAREVGDRTGEMTTRFNFSVIDLAQNNYLAARIQGEQALRICRDVNYKMYEGAFLTNLADIADELGEYALALEYNKLGVSILQEIGDRDLRCQVIRALGMVFYHSGQYEMARENGQEALAIALETKNKLVQNRALTLQGHVFRELGNLDQATDFYQEAFDIALELDLPRYAKQAQTGMVCIALAQGNLAQAQASMTEILQYLEMTPLSTVDEIFWIYLTCYRILQATSDPRARPTLKAAHTLLQEIAARIDDEPMRTSFLQNVRFNREIIEAWEALAAS